MKKQSQILISLFVGIFLLTGCQGQAPASQSAGSAASSTVSLPSASAPASSAVSSSAPEPTQEWGIAGVGDSVTVAGMEFTLESFTMGENEIIIEISRSSSDPENWLMWIPDTEGWTGGGLPYLLIAESEDGVDYKVELESSRPGLLNSPQKGYTFTFKKSTWEGGELPADPTFHLTFADETGIIPGFTFS